MNCLRYLQIVSDTSTFLPHIVYVNTKFFDVSRLHFDLDFRHRKVKNYFFENMCSCTTVLYVWVLKNSVCTMYRLTRHLQSHYINLVIGT